MPPYDGGTLHARLFDLGVVADGRLRVPAGRAVGVEPAADPVKRIMVNVGSDPWEATSGCRTAGGGPARPDAGRRARGVAESA